MLARVAEFTTQAKVMTKIRLALVPFSTSFFVYNLFVHCALFTSLLFSFFSLGLKSQFYRGKLLPR